MQQITAPLADLPEDPVAAAANPEFPVVLRGYDRMAVEAYVNRITQLVAELYATRSPEGAVRRALERVGGEVSAILQSAHETADQLTTDSRAEAEERMMRAREEADALERSSRQRARELEQQAQRRVHELDAEVDRIWAERDRIVGDVRRLAEELGTVAGAAATRFPPESSAETAAADAEPGEEFAAERDVGPATAEHSPFDDAEQSSLDNAGVDRPGGFAEPFGPEDEAEDEEPFAESGPSAESEPFAEPEPLAESGPSAEPRPFAVDEYVGPAQPIRRDPAGEEPAVEEYVGRAQPIRREPLHDETEATDELSSDEGPAGTPGEPEGAPQERVGAGEAPPGADEVEALAAEKTAQLPVEAASDAPVAGEAAFFEQPTIAHEPVIRALASDARVIDLMHLGRERVIGCWRVGDVLIDPGPSSCLEVLLDALGDQRPRALLLTHIHLDHAGASGSLVERWPDLEVYVHERGAPHLTDPSRLLESARRLYGDDMDRLWGEVRPVPAENLHLLRGGERLLGGAFEVVYTPGHASHHVSYLESQTAFVGDTGGVRITPETLTIPPTPPPDIDIEAWHQSINRVLAWKPRRLAITHFGSSDDVTEQLNELSERLDNLAALARTEDEETFIATIREEIESDAGSELVATYAQAAPPEQLYAGLKRYWEKRDEAGTSARSAPAEASTHAGRFGRPGSD